MITGASSGIGEAMVALLTKSGMKVVGCGRRMDRLKAIAEKYPNTYPYQCDMEKKDEIVGMFDWIEGNPELGRVDVCVPNAGFSPSKSLLDGTFEEWQSMLNVNVLSLTLCCQLSIKSMLKHNVMDGVIVNVASVLGHTVNTTNLRFYSATKHAVRALTEGFRLECRDLGNNNIRVTSISPGIVETEFFDQAYKTQPGRSKQILNAMKALESEDMQRL